METPGPGESCGEPLLAEAECTGYALGVSIKSADSGEPDVSTGSHAPESAPPELARTIDEMSNWCFGCGPGNPQGLHLKFVLEQDAERGMQAVATVELTRYHEGPPGHIHGGVVAVLMDEAMSKMNSPLNVLAMTRHMEVDYLKPCPLGVKLKLVSYHLKRDGRKLFHAAELSHPDGTVLARSKGFFLGIDVKALPPLG